MRLVRGAGGGVAARKALSVLTEYGSVRRNKDGNYELVKPFFVVSNQKKMAFEPVAAFLSDASATLSKILRRPRNSRAAELFWRKVESTRISRSAAEKFNAFASERSLLFLEEMDDWLVAHSKNITRGRGTRRVGLGVFLIDSDLETGR
jgi:hypothetical protein